MARLEAEALLAMVKEMDRLFCQYLAGAVSVDKAISEIMATCERLRAVDLNDGMRYWLGAIERHAMDLHRPYVHSEEKQSLFSSSEFLRIHLLKDISFLRLQIANARSAAV